jgi:hypothetical protein
MNKQDQSQKEGSFGWVRFVLICLFGLIMLNSVVFKGPTVVLFGVPPLCLGLIAVYWFIRQQFTNMFLALTLGTGWLICAFPDYRLLLIWPFLIFFISLAILEIKKDRERR